ncbi:MAG TPA: transposase [Burkholderiales bacterium]|nr:transposase [Burkholderiales bacterium]
MSRKDFLTQLDNFRHEAYVAAQYLYSEMAVQHAASKSKKLLNRLNLTPRFWLTHSAATQAAAYLSLARVFDKSSAYNVDALLNTFEASLSLFSREALAERKRDGKAKDPEWLAGYLEEAHYPTQKDVDRLRSRVAAQRVVYERAIEPARHKYIAHRVKVDQDEVKALFGAGLVKELWRMVTFLYALYTALSQQYINGRKPILRPLRYSVRTIYDSARSDGAPHEAIVAETRRLMELLETVTPNSSIERTSNRLRRSAAAHVER